MKNYDKKIKILLIICLTMFGFENIVFAASIKCDTFGYVLKDLQYIFDYAKFLVPLLIIGLSSYDFIKAITSKEAKGVNKALNILLRRLALAIVFFFLPVLLNVFFKMIGINADTCLK